MVTFEVEFMILFSLNFAAFLFLPTNSSESLSEWESNGNVSLTCLLSIVWAAARSASFIEFWISPLLKTVVGIAAANLSTICPGAASTFGDWLEELIRLSWASGFVPGSSRSCP